MRKSELRFALIASERAATEWQARYLEAVKQLQLVTEQMANPAQLVEALGKVVNPQIVVEEPTDIYTPTDPAANPYAILNGSGLSHLRPPAGLDWDDFLDPRTGGVPDGFEAASEREKGE